jgi:hypothetical protein
MFAKGLLGNLRDLVTINTHHAKKGCDQGCARSIQGWGIAEVKGIDEKSDSFIVPMKVGNAL